MRIPERIVHIYDGIVAINDWKEQKDSAFLLLFLGILIIILQVFYLRILYQDSDGL